MELIRISDRKLKIMLTPTDMTHFELDSQTLGEDSVQMHRSFRLLLDELRLKIGFDADDKHISIQYFPSREGGCEMFISNLQESNTEGAVPVINSISKNALQIHTGKKSTGCFKREFAYRLPTLDALLAVCERLRRINYICESTAYRDRKKQYYLLMSALSESPFSTPDEIGFILEYGTIENYAMRKQYLQEHGTVLCGEKAIEVLSKLY